MQAIFINREGFKRHHQRQQASEGSLRHPIDTRLRFQTDAQAQSQTELVTDVVVVVVESWPRLP
jgi:hypothetical protein